MGGGVASGVPRPSGRDHVDESALGGVAHAAVPGDRLREDLGQGDRRRLGPARLCQLSEHHQVRS